MMDQHTSSRVLLDRLFAYDALTSIGFGVLALFTPHFLLVRFYYGTNHDPNEYYNHSVHEMVRLYSCLKIALGWILWNIRYVDDGILRKRFCESMMICYTIEFLVIIRAQFTDRVTVFINYIFMLVLLVLIFLYGSFRFGKNGNSIKVYELPTSSILQ